MANGRRLVSLVGLALFTGLLSPDAPSLRAQEEDEPRISRIKLVDKGIYRYEIVGKIADPKTPQGFREKVGDITLLEDTTTIPIKAGRKFGLRFAVVGEPKGSQVTLKVVRVYPEGGRRSARTGEILYKDDYLQKATIGGKSIYFGSSFGPKERPLGVWTYQVWHKDRLLLEQEFEVVEP